MAKAPYTKGQAVVLFRNWDLKGQFTFRNCIVKSCGAIQMTLEMVESGKMIKTFIRAEQYSDGSVVPASQFATEADIVAYGTQRAAAFIADELERNNRKVGHEVYHQASVLENITRLKSATPTCISFEEACAKVAAKYK